ncbi:MAG: hypothetical protein ACLGJC_09430 [Alphaproteobacteria bacterium]
MTATAKLNKRSAEELPVKVGAFDTLPIRMTREQAQRYGERNMPADLKRAGFQCVVFRSDAEIHGGHWFRINYGK